MLYIWHINIVAGTEEAEPIEQKKNLRQGIITKIEVKFPAGCHGYVYATVSHRLTQLFPFNVTGAARGDDETVTGLHYWELKEARPSLILRGWAPDASYDHLITYRITVLPKKLASMIPVIELLTSLLRRMGVFR